MLLLRAVVGGDRRQSTFLTVALTLGLWTAVPIGTMPAAVAQAEAPREEAEPLAVAALAPRIANYDIEVGLDPDRRELVGRQRLTWRNAQPSPATQLRFHLYWNAWRNSRSTWMLEDAIRGRSDLGEDVRPEDWGWIEVESAVWRGAGDQQPVDLTAGLAYDAPDDGNPDDRTVLVMPLPVPVEPGGTVVVELEWRARVPRTFARTGHRGDFWLIAHWFPKLGVWEPDGWNCHQYHAGTEYFSDYGVYDVAIRLPERYVVGATGREVERRVEAGGVVLHRYRQADVHAFTWTASPDYLVRERTFRAAGLPAVAMRLLLQPEHAAQEERYFAATETALELYGRWYGPYPYGHLTIVDPAYGSGAGGMEYPTLFTGGSRLFSPEGGGSPEGVTIHEAGHQFWYGVVGNNEFEHAWMDEGLNTFSTIRAEDERFGMPRVTKRYFSPPGTEQRGFFPVLFPDLRTSRESDGNRLERYRRGAGWDSQARPTWRYFPATGSQVSYTRTALWLYTLERQLGWPTLQGILSTFYRRYSFRHPTPEEFFAVAQEVSGRDLDPFFEQVYYRPVEFDYAIDSVRSVPAAARGWVEEDGEMVRLEPSAPAAGEKLYRSEVVVRRLGGGVFPVEVLLTFEDGSELRRAWDGEYRWTMIVEERPAKLVSAEVDPDRILLLDVNRTNNSRLVEPRATFPAVRWALRWMVWFQDFMETFLAFA